MISNSLVHGLKLDTYTLPGFFYLRTYNDLFILNSFGMFFSVFTPWAYAVYLVFPGYVVYYLVKLAIGFASGIGKGGDNEGEASSGKSKKKEKEKNKVKYVKGN